MPVTTLQEVIEEYSTRRPITRVIIGGATLPKVTSISYSFAIGEVPTATIVVPSRHYLPLAVGEEAAVQIWFGFQVGMVTLDRLVFGGAVVDSVSSSGNEVVIECVMDGPRKLVYGYNRRINYDFTAVIAEDAVIDLLALAGVSNYYVELDPWTIGTAVPQDIEFSSYGEAINKISEVDGNPWYALPTGQVRVENRDPIPSPTARRTYFSGILTGSISTNPIQITNTDALPLITDISRRKFRQEVANFIHVDGAVVVTLGPNGEQNSQQVTEEVDGASGQFPNGAYWIPTPPLFQDFVFANEVIDTNAKAFTVAERYFLLKNRLFEKIPLNIPGDPDVFLCSTIKIVDPNYSGVSSLYFVEGYTTRIDAQSCETTLQITGGDESGTTGFASPFAEFYWVYSALHDLTGGGIHNISSLNLGPNTNEAAKLCEDLPADASDETQREDQDPFTDTRTVIIGIDGTASQDFDGYIVSWEWEWTDSALVVHNLTGPRITLAIDPDLQSSIEVTLTVTDDSGRTGLITKTIYTGADYLTPPDTDHGLNDTSNGGGVVNGPCDCDPDTEDCSEEPPDTPPVPEPGGEKPELGEEPPETVTPPPGACEGMSTHIYVAAEAYAMGTEDNRTWNDLSKAAAGVAGNFINVAAGILYRTQKSYAIFGTDLGEIVITNDICATGSLVFTHPAGAAINALLIDGTTMGNPAEGEEYGDENTESTPNDGTIPVYTQASPGVMTYTQCYQQCLAVGFSNTSAIIATAIMKGESGLDSDATNSAGNQPPSTDRGIAQFNSYYHPEVTDAMAFNTAIAIAEMYRVSSGGTDFSPWSVYNAGVHEQYLASVQAELGITGDIGDPESGTVPIRTIRSFKVWFGASNGDVYVSNSSGREWTLFGRPNFDGWPIYAMIIDPRMSIVGEYTPLAVFGGDSSNPDTMIKVLMTESGFEWAGIPIGGTLLAHLQTGSFHIVDAQLNATALMILLSDNTVWFTADFLDPEVWYQGSGVAGALESIARGFDGEFLVAGTNSYFTSDNEVFA